jgi:hypothetical protein
LDSLPIGLIARIPRNEPRSEEVQLPIENKYAAIAAVVGFLLVLWLTDGSLIAAFGVLALIAGIGWAVRRLRHWRGRAS